MISSNAAMSVVYDRLQVVLSILIAISASYAALDLAGRVTTASGRVRLTWLIGGSLAMGIGIWAMHYVGMLAFRLPSQWNTTGQLLYCHSWREYFALPLH